MQYRDGTATKGEKPCIPYVANGLRDDSDSFDVLGPNFSSPLLRIHEFHLNCCVLSPSLSKELAGSRMVAMKAWKRINAYKRPHFDNIRDDTMIMSLVEM